MKKLVISSLLILCSFFSHSAIVTQYDITNFHGGTGQHGLWTNKHFNDNTFDIVSGTFAIDETNNELTATFNAIATNNDGLTAYIALTLAQFEELTSNVTYKKENGKSVNDIVEDPNALASIYNQDIDYFILLGGGITVKDAAGNVVEDRQLINCCAPVFQFGNGANAKNKTEFGASAWVNNQATGAGHWDLNVALVPVSAPSAFSIMLLVFASMASRKLIK